MKENDVLIALQEAYKRAGTQTALANIAGISQGRIADYLNRRYSIGNMTVTTLFKIFPDIKIDFFGGKSGDSGGDLMKAQLLEIFDRLDNSDKLRCITLVAANFGDKIRGKG